MRKWQGRHPGEDELLRYADGELRAGDAEQVREHLGSCWQCRAELEGLEKAIGECVRYRKQVLEVHLPPPPAPWADLYRRFDEEDAALAGRSWWGRFADGLWALAQRPQHWVPAVAVLITVLGLVVRFSDTPAVEASALLRQAVTAASARPDAPRRVEIRTRRQRVARAVPIVKAAAAPEEELSQVRDMFARARYDFSDPLSARSFLEWRAQLREKHDEVARIEDHAAPEGNRYRIRTTTSVNELREATLDLRMEDLRPVEAALRFVNDEWVGLYDLPGDLAPATEARGGAASTRAAAPLSAPKAEPGERPQDAPLATAAEELQVLAALHRLGADLGEPVEVSRTGPEIVVTGLGLEPARQHQIEAALRDLPRAVVRFSAEAQGGERPEPETFSRYSAAAPLGELQSRLERNAGGRVPLEQLAASVLEDSDQMMSRVFAVRRLAERFPPAVEAQLAAGDRRVLRALLREHASALHWRVEEIQRRMQPALSALGAPPPASSRAPLPATWQPATEEVFRRARLVEKALAALLGGAPSELTPDSFPAALAAGLNELRAGVAAYETLLTP